MSDQLILAAIPHVLVGTSNVVLHRSAVSNVTSVTMNARHLVMNARHLVMNVRHLAMNARHLAMNVRLLVMIARLLVMIVMDLAAVVRRRTGRRGLKAADQIVRPQRKPRMQAANRRHPMMNTGMNLRAGCGTTKRRRNQRQHRHPDQCPQRLMTNLMKMMTKRSLQWLLRRARTATKKMLRHVVAGGGAVVVGADVVGVMKRKRLPRQARHQMPPVALWTLMMISVKSCSKKIRKISSACRLAALRLSVASRMSLLRPPLENQSRTMMTTTMIVMK